MQIKQDFLAVEICTFCGASSEPDFIQIDFLLKRMFRFFVIRDKCSILTFRDKKWHTLTFRDKKLHILMREMKEKEEILEIG